MVTQKRPRMGQYPRDELGYQQWEVYNTFNANIYHSQWRNSSLGDPSGPQWGLGNEGSNLTPISMRAIRTSLAKNMKNRWVQGQSGIKAVNMDPVNLCGLAGNLVRTL